MTGPLGFQFCDHSCIIDRFSLVTLGYLEYKREPVCWFTFLRFESYSITVCDNALPVLLRQLFFLLVITFYNPFDNVILGFFV